MFSLIILSLCMSITFGSVTELDSSNFDSIAMDPSKNVLVEFYTQTCGACRGLAPIYDKVSQAFESEPNCMVAKIDVGTYKDIGERFSIPAYPTIKLFSTTNKLGEDYDYINGRGEQDFINYMNNKCNARRMSGGAVLP